eukprot:1353457-Pleurochrysis_carterae.AAC.1
MEKWPRRAWTRISNCPSNCPNLPPRTLDRVILASHRVHKGATSERDGVVCGLLADADVVVVIRKNKAQLIVQ